jgi:hypothetical protein
LEIRVSALFLLRRIVPPPQSLRPAAARRRAPESLAMASSADWRESLHLYKWQAIEPRAVDAGAAAAPPPAAAARARGRQLLALVAPNSAPGSLSAPEHGLLSEHVACVDAAPAAAKPAPPPPPSPPAESARARPLVLLGCAARHEATGQLLAASYRDDNVLVLALTRLPCAEPAAAGGAPPAAGAASSSAAAAPLGGWRRCVELPWLPGAGARATALALSDDGRTLAVTTVCGEQPARRALAARQTCAQRARPCERLAFLSPAVALPVPSSQARCTSSPRRSWLPFRARRACSRTAR